MAAWKKLCLSCMKKVPLFAGRCPYCLDENQGVHGRFFLILIFVVGLMAAAYWYTSEPNKQNINHQTTEDIDQQLMREFKEEGF